MTRNATSIVAAFALVASIAAFSIVTYDFLNPPSANAPPEDPISGIKNTWYSEYLYSVSCYASEAWYAIPVMRISFDVAINESVLFSYTGTVRLDDSAAHTWVEICFNVDGAALTEPYQRVEGTTTGAGNWWIIPVSLQCSLALAPGAHNVTIQFRGYRILDSVRGQTLLVQTYIP